MRPLPWLAVGWVVVLLTADAGGYDLLADPLGWLLIGYGAAHLPLDVPDRRRLLATTGLAGAVAVAVWPAPVARWLDRSDDSLAWAASLPQVAVAVLLCAGLAVLADRVRDRRAAAWLRVARTVSLVAGLLPVLVLGGHLTALGAATDVVSLAAPLLLIVLLLRYAGRPWAGVPDPATAGAERTSWAQPGSGLRPE